MPKRGLPQIIKAAEKKEFFKVAEREYKNFDIEGADKANRDSLCKELYQQIMTDEGVRKFEQAVGDEPKYFKEFIDQKIPPSYKKEGEKEEKGTITLKKEELDAIVSGVERRLEAKFKDKSGINVTELVSEIVGQMNPDAVSRAYKEEQIDKSDYLEEPVMFFTYNNYWAIHSEKRFGHEVLPPYKPIKFTNISTNVSGVGRYGKQTIQIAAAQIYSKKEADWLRKSPSFNVIFFESFKEASVIDKYKVQKMAEALESISGLNDYQIMQRYISLGLPAIKDVEQMKYKVLLNIAEQSMKDEKDISLAAAVSKDASIEEKSRNNGVRVNTPAY